MRPRNARFWRTVLQATAGVLTNAAKIKNGVTIITILTISNTTKMGIKIIIAEIFGDKDAAEAVEIVKITMVDVILVKMATNSGKMALRPMKIQTFVILYLIGKRTGAGSSSTGTNGGASRNLNDICDIRNANIFSLNLNFSDFICINTSISNKSLTLLVDTQADISILKLSEIVPNTFINLNEVVNIRGVTDGTIRSIGTAKAKLFLKDSEVQQIFHIVDHSGRYIFDTSRWYHR